MSIILRKELINEKWAIWVEYDENSAVILEFNTEPTEQEVQTELDKLKQIGA